jgi:HTH-type transcriptional regulator / antitoxin HigA
MNVSLIKNEAQYDDALHRVYQLMQTDIREGSPESDEVELLSVLVKEYEVKYHPMPTLNPLEAIKLRMKQMDISESQLTELFGARSRKSEILSGKRKLSLAMIRKISKTLSIPAEVLIKAY